MDQPSEWIVSVGRPRWQCRWWLRTKQVYAVEIEPDGIKLAGAEFYVPWWAWPLELAHRAIFGRSKLLR